MKHLILKTALLSMGFAVLLAGCKKDKGETNEEEVITTMILTFTPTAGGAPLVFEYDDPDGPGGTAPTQDEIVLAPSSTYNVSVQLLNRTETPAEDITLEVEEEGAAHRFYYVPSSSSLVTVSGLDNDLNGMPLGINSTWSTGAAGTGTVTVTLRHYPADPPNKAAADPVNSTKSSTDAEVVFSVKVQ